MDDEQLEGWTPAAKVVFTDEELVRHLREARRDPATRVGNWLAFFDALPAPERERLEAEAERDVAHGPREVGH